jgi:predicted RNA binding protein YcfA (HicA-like mRNA interferase family)
MVRRAKLFEKLKNNPKDATFEQIAKLLGSEGFSLDRISGSHHIYKNGTVIFVLPVHGKKVKTVYVKRLIEIIEKIDI